MFFQIVLVLLILSCSVGVAEAEWTKVMTGPEAGGYTLYFEPNSLRIDKKSGMVKMWLLYDFKTAQKNEKDDSYLSLRFQRQYDCKEERAQTLGQSFFDGNMARGKEISNDSIEGLWEPVVPGSTGQTLWVMACGHVIGMPPGSQRYY